MTCHKPHERLDYVKTYFAMAGKRVETNPAPVPPGAVVATIVALRGESIPHHRAIGTP